MQIDSTESAGTTVFAKRFMSNCSSKGFLTLRKASIGHCENVSQISHYFYYGDGNFQSHQGRHQEIHATLQL